MRSLRLLAVVVLVLLAGCSGLSSGDGAPDRDPYGVDDELEPALSDGANRSDDVSAERIAPGLTTVGVDNVSALLEAHYGALEAESGNGTYVATVREDWEAENGSSVREVRGSFVVAAPDQWYRSVRRRGPPDHEQTVSELWVDGDERLVRTERPDETVEYERSDFPWGRPLEGFLRSTLSETTNATVEPWSDDEPGRYVVTVSNEPEDDGPGRVGFLVDESGLLERVSYVYGIDYEQSDVDTVRAHLEFDPTGPDSLERPDWYDEALAETDADGSGGEGVGDGSADEGADGDAGADDDAGADEPDDGDAEGDGSEDDDAGGAGSEDEA